MTDHPQGHGATTPRESAGLPGREDELRKAFDIVRTKFFPRWDKARRWRCQWMDPNSKSGNDGLCKPPAHTILISRRLPAGTNAEFAGVIIHEICHALRPRSSHGAPWLERMARAAKRAETLGEPTLARWLHEEIERYRVPRTRLGTAFTYREIRNFVAESGTVPPFKVLVAEFSRSRSMKPTEFLKRYPRAKQVYLAAVA
jgi:hypothetical protein